MPFPAIFLDIAERCADAALRCASMGARRIELANDGGFNRFAGVEGRHQARTARAHDERIELVILCHRIYSAACSTGCGAPH